MGARARAKGENDKKKADPTHRSKEQSYRPDDRTPGHEETTNQTRGTTGFERKIGIKSQRTTRGKRKGKYPQPLFIRHRQGSGPPVV